LNLIPILTIDLNFVLLSTVEDRYGCAVFHYVDRSIDAHLASDVTRRDYSRSSTLQLAFCLWCLSEV